MQKPKRHHALFPGITLVELVLVMGTGVVLLVLTLVISKALQGSEVTRTEFTIVQCDILLDEFSIASGLQSVRAPSDEGNRHMFYLLQRVSQMESLKPLVIALGDRYNPDTFELLDHWDTPMIYCFDGNGAASYNRTPGGGEAPVRNEPYFASAGPDLEWGSWDNDKDEPANQAAADNIYSFNVTER